MHLRGPLDGPQMLSYRNKVEFGVFDLVIAAGQISKRLYAAVMDSFVTSPLFRWTWANDHIGVVGSKFVEVRAADHFSIKDMMAGRYVLGHKHIDTQGISPFAVEHASPQWFDELHRFSWLYHFTAARDEGEKRFAMTLALDWVARYGDYDPSVWGAPNNGATRDQLDQAFRGVDLWAPTKASATQSFNHCRGKSSHWRCVRILSFNPMFKR